MSNERTARHYTRTVLVVAVTGLVGGFPGCNRSVELPATEAQARETATSEVRRHAALLEAFNCDVPENIISNCKFSAGATAWATEIAFGTAAATQSSLDGELHVMITDGGTADWNVQPRQEGLSLESGVEYVVRFDVRAVEARTLNVSLTQNEDPWTSYAGVHTLALTTTMQAHSFRFVMNHATDHHVKLEFRAGLSAADLFIDNVFVAPVAPGSTPQDDCDDEHGCRDDTALRKVACDTEDNLIRNCDFAAGLSDWAAEIAFGGQAIQSASEGELSVLIANAGTEDWQIQPRQEGLRLVEGTQYEVRFRARAQAPRPITISLTGGAPSWTSYSGARRFDLTTQMQTFSFQFQMDGPTDADAKFEIRAGAWVPETIGKVVPDLYLDDVYVGAARLSDRRPRNRSCVAGDAPAAGAFTTVQYWPQIPVPLALELVQEPAEVGDAFFVVTKDGVVYKLSNDPTARGAPIFLDLRGRLWLEFEAGMTSMVFDPNYATNRYVYVGYVASNHELRLSRFQTDSDFGSAPLSSEQVLFRFPRQSGFHNAGALAMGSGPIDGEVYLYMTVGDDGNNELGDSTPLRVPLYNYPNGKLLRVAPGEYRGDRELPWSWEDGSTNSYIVASGLRNPWRMAVDGNQIWIGNVGFDKTEEINVFDVRADIGANYGWPWCEGDTCCGQPGEPMPCDLSNLPPQPENLNRATYSYPRSDGPSGESAVIGGHIYRGRELPELFGHYIFGDFSDQVIYAYDPASGTRRLLLSNVGQIVDFAVDRAGEMYFVAISGQAFRITRSTAERVSNWPPRDLMDWGCFESPGNGRPTVAPGVIPFDVAQPFWSDGATKERYFAVPDGTRLNSTDPDHWQLPVGGVTIKNFYWNEAIFETRLLVRHNDGSYAGYSYEWTDASTARLVPFEGTTRALTGITWNYPSRSQCLICHTASAGRTLGLDTRQLNIDSLDPATGVNDNQVTRYASLGLLDSEQPMRLSPHPGRADLTDDTLSLNDRVASYLHVNCSNCHRGPLHSESGRATWDARVGTKFSDKGLCDARPITTVQTETIGDQRLVIPQDHARSTLWLRTHVRNNTSMPPLGSTVVDDVGVELLRTWIDTLDMCE